MSESPSNLEIEPEWCSAAVLTSINAAQVPNESFVEVVVNVPPIAPVAELVTLETAKSVETPTSEVAPEKPRRVVPKSRPDAKFSVPIKSTQPTRVSRWVGMLRSRRLRIAATVASLFVVGGLIVLNWRNGSSNSGDDVADMDLSEFNDVSGFDAPRIGNPVESQPRELITDAESVSPTDRFPRMTSGPRLPPLGLATHADHETLPDQPVRSVVPAVASSSGTPGAVLTGRIEFDGQQRPADSSARPNRTLGMR